MLTCFGVVAAAVHGAGSARAQVPPVTTTSSTAPSGSTPSTTTTTTAPGGGLTPPPAPGTGGPSTTTTTTPPGGDGSGSTPGSGAGDGSGPSGSPSGSASGTTPGSSSSPLSPSGNPGDVGSGVVPAQYVPLINSVHRTPPNSDKALLDALQPLIKIGLPPVEAYVVGMGQFPVAGAANWGDDFLEPRFGPPFHLHQGNDVFADCGLPIRSPADGTLRQSADPLGGTTVYVTLADGTYFYMAHLSAYVAGQTSGLAVQTGEIVGFVGNTGDAVNGACHVHFEIHPKGGAAVDPKPFLDGAMADALALVPRILALYQGSQRSQATAPIAAGQLLGGLDGGPSPSDGDLSLAVPAGPSRDGVLWSAAAAPAGGALEVASAELADMTRAGWDGAGAQQAAAQAAWTRAQALTNQILAPTTPPLLRALLGM